METIEVIGFPTLFCYITVWHEYINRGHSGALPATHRDDSSRVRRVSCEARPSRYISSPSLATDGSPTRRITRYAALAKDLLDGDHFERMSHRGSLALELPIRHEPCQELPGKRGPDVRRFS